MFQLTSPDRLDLRAPHNSWEGKDDVPSPPSLPHFTHRQCPGVGQGHASFFSSCNSQVMFLTLKNFFT